MLKCLKARMLSFVKNPSVPHTASIPGNPSKTKYEQEDNVASYNTSEFKKGLKVEIEGEPFLMIECNFVKPGKGNALYKCKLRNLLKGTVLDRTFKAGISLDSADITEFEVQFLYRQNNVFFFMENESYEQYELSEAQVDEAWMYLKEGMLCQMMSYNDVPISVTPPNHVVMKIEYCEPCVKGNTATNVTKPVKVETGAEFQCPAFVEMGEFIRLDTRTGEYIERAKPEEA